MTETNVPQGDAFNDDVMHFDRWSVVFMHFHAAVGVWFPKTRRFSLISLQILNSDTLKDSNTEQIGLYYQESRMLAYALYT